MSGCATIEKEAPQRGESESTMPKGVYQRPSNETSFWAKVEKTDGCWLWTAAKNRAGYGKLRFDGKVGLAHRYAYELLVGPIPKGLTLDLLCRVRACVNRAPLEVVTSRENILRGASFSAIHARKTHCVHGHPFDEENTYHQPTRPMWRECRACRLVRQKAGAS